MKKINIRFEADDSLENIEVIIRANKHDGQISGIIEKLKQSNIKNFTVLDSNKCSCVISEDDIILISSDRKQMRIITENGSYCAKQSLPNDISDAIKLKLSNPLHLAKQSSPSVSFPLL